jgi:hypothetical protein
MLSRAALLFSLLAALAASSHAQDAHQLTTTAADRRSVNVTVYNSDVGLVRETRTVRGLPASGRFSLRFADVAAAIRPETVHLVSLTAPQSLSVLEQNYQYDLLNPGKLLDKYVGREITLVLRRFEAGREILTPTKATLLSNNNGQVWRIGDQIVLNPAYSEMHFPELPSNLVATPTLVWDLENEGAAEQTVEASYLTGGMDWKADYVLVIDETDRRGDLQGWVTLVNRSGVGFEGARLQLVAGDVNRVSENEAPMDAVAGGRAERAKPAAQFAAQAFFEYHLYTLERPATVREQETKQITLLEAAGFAASKDYVVNGQPHYYHGYNAPGQPVREPVGVFVEFRNSRENRLGMPLPAGIIRLYKRDAGGNQQFIGENRIAHTPRDEDVRIKVGDAFDIVSERRQTDYRVVSRRLTEYAYEITVRNHKDVPVEVVVNEPVGESDWQIVSSATACTGSPRCAAFKPEKTSATSARLRVPVERDGETKVSYRIRVKN